MQSAATALSKASHLFDRCSQITSNWCVEKLFITTRLNYNNEPITNVIFNVFVHVEFLLLLEAE